MTQTAVAAAIVGLAAIWLARQVWLVVGVARGTHAGDLGNCGSCSRNPTKRSPAVVELGLAKPKRQSSEGA